MSLNLFPLSVLRCWPSHYSDPGIAGPWEAQSTGLSDVAQMEKAAWLWLETARGPRLAFQPSPWVLEPGLLPYP